MSENNTGLTRWRDPAALALRFLAGFGERRREDSQTISVTDFIRLAQFGRETGKGGPDPGLKELKVTWVKTPEELEVEE